ncbi:carbamoyl phosphate synthetase subunit beta (fragment) [Gammaproteobacteria bacterium]
MEIVHDAQDLARYMREAVEVSNDSPVLLDRFLDDATEVDVDAVCDGKRVVIAGIMEHIEQAGIHSGDSACSLPPYSLSAEIQQALRVQVEQMAHALGVVGLMNTQFAVQGKDIYVLEVNPRASRTVPFVSKATGIPFAKVAARCMAGKTLEAQGITEETTPPYFSVKEAVFPFLKFPGVDPILGPEMKSTGEVMGVGATFEEAFAKAQLGAGMELPRSGRVFISVRTADRVHLKNVGKAFQSRGFEILATRGTAEALRLAGVSCKTVAKVGQGRPDIVDMLKNGEVHFVVNTTEGRKALADSYTLRRTALQHKVSYTTTMAGALATALALRDLENATVHRLQDLHRRVVKEQNQLDQGCFRYNPLK